MQLSMMQTGTHTFPILPLLMSAAQKRLLLFCIKLVNAGKLVCSLCFLSVCKKVVELKITRVMDIERFLSL